MGSTAMSAWRSENVRTRSGFRARILSIFAEVKALTRGFSRRACGGRGSDYRQHSSLCCLSSPLLSAMAATERIIFQPYVTGRGNSLLSGQAVLCRNPDEARRRAEKAMAGGRVPRAHTLPAMDAIAAGETG